MVRPLSKLALVLLILGSAYFGPGAPRAQAFTVQCPAPQSGCHLMGLVGNPPCCEYGCATFYELYCPDVSCPTLAGCVLTGLVGTPVPDCCEYDCGQHQELVCPNDLGE